MAWQKLRIQQRFCLLDERQQNFGRHPGPSFQYSADRQRQFCLPGLVQFHEAVYAPIKKSSFLFIATVFRRKQRQKLAARRVDTTSCREASQVCTQRTPIEKEKPWAAGQIDSFAFARSRRQNLNGQVLYVSKG